MGFGQMVFCWWFVVYLFVCVWFGIFISLAFDVSALPSDIAALVQILAPLFKLPEEAGTHS